MAEVAESERGVFEDVHGKFRRAEDRQKAVFWPKWDHYDTLYHGYARFKDAVRSTAPNDQDTVFQDARGEFGRELHIPFTFAVIELLHARSFATPPSIRLKPRNPAALEHRGTITAHLQDQLERAKAELAFQTIGKSGQMYGLGVGKTLWDERTRMVREVSRGETAPFTVGQREERVVFNGPRVGAIDVRDFFWDEFAFDFDSLRWGVHRVWQSTNYVLARLGWAPDGSRIGDAPAAWDSETAQALTPSDIRNSSSTESYSDAHASRIRAQGYSEAKVDDADVHEILEFHDGENVIVLLDRKWPVAIKSNPRWHGGLPFFGYRPIEVLHSIVGKGSVEPIEDLQHEVDMMRTDRRWNAIMKLHQAYAYRIGTVDPTQVKIGPGTLVGVNGDPNNLLAPLTVGDVPNSSYQEEELLVQNIMQAAGASDPAEAVGGQETATGVMAVQQAQAVRVSMAIRRAELELVQPVAQDFADLNRQHLVEAQMVPVPPTAEQPDPQFAQLGPDQYQEADFDVQIAGGLRPDNAAQDRADAQQLLNALPVLQGIADPRQVALRFFELQGEQQPERLLTPPGPQVPPETLDIAVQKFAEAGIDPASAKQVLADAMNEALDARQGGGAGGTPPGPGAPEGSAEPPPGG